VERTSRPIAVSASAWDGGGDSGGGDYGLLPQVHFVDSSIEPSRFVPPCHMVAHCKPCHSRVQHISTNKVSSLEFLLPEKVSIIDFF